MYSLANLQPNNSKPIRPIVLQHWQEKIEFFLAKRQGTLHALE